MNAPTPCPTPVELVRASSERIDGALAAHLTTCATCRAALAADDALRALARDLPDAPPSSDNAIARATLLARAREPTRRVGRGALAAGGVAASVAVAAVVLFVLVREPASRGVVLPHGQVELVKLSTSPDEIVRLVDGTITVEVQKLRDGERFRVVTGDAEVEVRGTAFDVVAVDDVLHSVRVLHGSVEVRVGSAAPVVLLANERWSRPEASTKTPAADVEEPSGPAERLPVTLPPRPRREHEVRGPEAGLSAALAASARARVDAAPTGAVPVDVASVNPDAGVPTDLEREPAPLLNQTIMSADEIAYAEGWDALRADRPRAAAESFAQVLETGRTELHEDAAFWRAVALGRAKDAGAARALKEFIARFPSSTRHGEASVALGWILLDRRASTDAEAAFEVGVNDPSARVRRSARAGLDAVARGRAR